MPRQPKQFKANMNTILNTYKERCTRIVRVYVQQHFQWTDILGRGNQPKWPWFCRRKLFWKNFQETKCKAKITGWPNASARKAVVQTGSWGNQMPRQSKQFSASRATIVIIYERIYTKIFARAHTTMFSIKKCSKTWKSTRLTKFCWIKLFWKKS